FLNLHAFCEFKVAPRNGAPHPAFDIPFRIAPIPFCNHLANQGNGSFKRLDAPLVLAELKLSHSEREPGDFVILVDHQGSLEDLVCVLISSFAVVSSSQQRETVPIGGILLHYGLQSRHRSIHVSAVSPCELLSAFVVPPSDSKSGNVM